LYKAFVMFDRDGTIIDHIHHLKDPELVTLKIDLVLALRRLREAGFSLGIISNQSIIGRGIATQEQVNKVNNVIIEYLEKENIAFEFVYICPHIPEDYCDCRKPMTDLGRRAIIEHHMLPSISYVVGDQETDLVFAKKLGCRAIQVKGNAEKSENADYYSTTLNDAVTWIIGNG